MAQKMEKAWGVKPFNLYGATEVMIIGATCTNYKGMHAFEDMVIVEVVDEYNKPVPDGTRGHKILITNLYNYTQPLIRYELSDMITMSTEVCPCGRPFRLIKEIEGRSDDVLQLEGTRSKSVPVHPIHFHSLLGEFDQIREYQVVYEDSVLHVYLVMHGSQEKEAFARHIENGLKRQLESLGAKCPPIQIHFVERLQRDPKQMGKLKLVKIVKKN
jgi:phenylacetate-coenzyme A ligase PaaK-like adenylate-forming protein